MATTKRERQKAARRDKMERLQRESKRRQTLRRWVIITIVAAMVLGTGAALFAGNSNTTATTTTTSTVATTTTTVAPVTTTTAAPVTTSTIAATVSSFAQIPASDRSPAGKFGAAPSMTVPTSAAPTKLLSSDLIAGKGTVAKAGDTLQVQYVLGTYSSDKVVQSSWTSKPFSFILGVKQVIDGWDKGVAGMRVGGRRELIIPPSLGYGSVSPGAGIAEYDTLVFIIDLLKVTPAKAG